MSILNNEISQGKGKENKRNICWPSNPRFIKVTKCSIQSIKSYFQSDLIKKTQAQNDFKNFNYQLFYPVFEVNVSRYKIEHKL